MGTTRAHNPSMVRSTRTPGTNLEIAGAGPAAATTCRLCGDDSPVGTVCLACQARPPRKKSHVYNLKWKPERYYNQFKRYD